MKKLILTGMLVFALFAVAAVDAKPFVLGFQLSNFTVSNNLICILL